MTTTEKLERIAALLTEAQSLAESLEHREDRSSFYAGMLLGTMAAARPTARWLIAEHREEIARKMARNQEPN